MVSVRFPQLTRSLRLHAAESSRVRVRAFPLRLSASASECDLYRHPTPPNNSFKPTPCRGVGHVLCATLARVRRPATGGLTQALGGRKAFCKCAAHRLYSPASVGASFRIDSRRVATSVTSPGALTHHMRYVHRLRMLRFLSSRLPDPHAVTSDRSNRKFAGRAHTLPLRLSASLSGLQVRRHPTRLTIRSSRPRVVASAVCFALRLHASAAPPRAA